MKTGDTFEVERCFGQHDFDDFARLSGDDNPIHVDPAYAAKTRFGGTVAHGMLLYTGLRSAMSELFPGAMQIEQHLIFPTGTRAGEAVRYCFRVLSCGTDSGIKTARLAVKMLRPCGEAGLEGETLIRLGENR